MWNHTKKGKKIEFGRELTKKEKVKQKLNAKSFQQMSRAEKDDLLYDLLVMHDLVDTKY
ncbi:hypothetical protein [Tepidibacillus decaturensis]|uniref:hypothetical protein n=1 Tax=Tepidibacillus decaturensis TaxID=1413211 RepID=UPI00137B0593|nr:hypothetical protein [Tepidibacillus decaturensis]